MTEEDTTHYGERTEALLHSAICLCLEVSPCGRAPRTAFVSAGPPSPECERRHLGFVPLEVLLKRKGASPLPLSWDQHRYLNACS